MMSRKPSATRSSAVSQSTRVSEPSAWRSMGWSRRPSVPSVSPSADPLEHRRPKFAGCAGSPAIMAPPRPSGRASTPQPTPQYGQVVRIAGSGAWTFIASVHVLLIAAALLELSHEGDRVVGRARAVLRDDVDERPLHVLGHALGVTAYIDVGAVGEPSPQVAPHLAHAVLHVELLLAVARPGERQAREHARGLHAGELVLVEEVVVVALMAEEQPVAAGRLRSHALVQEGAERRDAGAGSNHDDGHGRIGREPEAMGTLHVDFESVAWPDALGEVGRCHAQAAPAIDFVAHGINGEGNTAGIALRR